MLQTQDIVLEPLADDYIEDDVRKLMEINLNRDSLNERRMFNLLIDSAESTLFNFAANRYADDISAMVDTFNLTDPNTSEEETKRINSRINEITQRVFINNNSRVVNFNFTELLAEIKKLEAGANNEDMYLACALRVIFYKLLETLRQNTIKYKYLFRFEEIHNILRTVIVNANESTINKQTKTYESLLVSVNKTIGDLRAGKFNKEIIRLMSMHNVTDFPRNSANDLTSSYLDEILSRYLHIKDGKIVRMSSANLIDDINTFDQEDSETGRFTGQILKMILGKIFIALQLELKGTENFEYLTDLINDQSILEQEEISIEDEIVETPKIKGERIKLDIITKLEGGLWFNSQVGSFLSTNQSRQALINLINISKINDEGNLIIRIEDIRGAFLSLSPRSIEFLEALIVIQRFHYINLSNIDAEDFWESDFAKREPELLSKLERLEKPTVVETEKPLSIRIDVARIFNPFAVAEPNETPEDKQKREEALVKFIPEFENLSILAGNLEEQVLSGKYLQVVDSIKSITQSLIILEKLKQFSTLEFRKVYCIFITKLYKDLLIQREQENDRKLINKLIRLIEKTFKANMLGKRIIWRNKQYLIDNQLLPSLEGFTLIDVNWDTTQPEWSRTSILTFSILDDKSNSIKILKPQEG